MAFNNYRWNRPFRKDPHGLIAKKHILDRIIDRNFVALMASGTPFVIWHHGFDLLNLTSSGTPDICWCNRNGTPDARHRICWGTGYLIGYQKYGYETDTFTTTSSNMVLSSNVHATSISVKDTMGNIQKKEVFELISGSTGTIDTPFIPLTNIQGYEYFVHTESHNVNNTVSYLYSYDGSTFNTIPSDLSTLDITKSQIKFRVVLSRNTLLTTLPYCEWFRFRFRNRSTLGEQHIEYRNKVNIPCYVASKSYVVQAQTKQNTGITFDWPIRFWSIINETLGARDVGMFLSGHYANRRFFQTNIVESTFGEGSKLMHVAWETRWVYGTDDATGIIYSLD